MASLWKAATSNAFNTSLNGNIGASDTSITLTSATNLQFPGTLVIDRVNTNGTATPTVREYISFTGIATNTLTGVTRGVGGSTAQTHSSGAIVEDCMDVSKWNDLLTVLGNAFTSGGAVDTTKIMDLTSTQTATNKTFTAPTITNPTVTGGGSLAGTFTGAPVFSGTPSITGTLTVAPVVQTITSMAAQAVNGALGNVFTRTLASSETFTQSGFTTGQYFIVEVTQGSSTTYTVTWFAGVTWRTSGGTAPVQTTTSNGKTTYGFRCTGSNTFDGYLVGQN